MHVKCLAIDLEMWKVWKFIWRLSFYISVFPFFPTSFSRTIFSSYLHQMFIVLDFFPDKYCLMSNFGSAQLNKVRAPNIWCVHITWKPKLARWYFCGYNGMECLWNCHFARIDVLHQYENDWKEDPSNAKRTRVILSAWIENQVIPYQESHLRVCVCAEYTFSGCSTEIA